MFRVLVVDDDADINEAVREGLRSAGYDVVGALSGTEALEEVERRLPDIVLLDQMLPDIDGVEVCRRLRESPRTRRVPIMFVSARAGQDARVKGLALGADDYVVKPFSMRELILRVGAVLRRATPVEMRLPPEWIRMRDQFRVWNRYADIHLARGEWRDCLELSRSILHNCDAALGPDERRRIYERIARCAQELGDADAHRSWQSKAQML
ncbi:MAG TPA: response regulator [Polyangia bacterium]|nr:response regulator [Polyangia bacterium]